MVSQRVPNRVTLMMELVIWGLRGLFQSRSVAELDEVVQNQRPTESQHAPSLGNPTEGDGSEPQ